MNKLLIGLVALALAAVMAVGAVNWPKPHVAEESHPAVVAESAQILTQAGRIMQHRGDELIAIGQPTGDDVLVAAGQQWKTYGATLEQEGQWMSVDPTAPNNLVAAPSIADWQAISRTATAILADPKLATSIDLEAAPRAGMALRSEGESLIGHSQIIEAMVTDADLLTLRHGAGQASAQLHDVTRRMAVLGQQLSKNGDELLEYWQQIRPAPFGVSVAR